ncbi:glycosyltransferase family 4 protein [Oerskovia flava]|uniref:glycosyltransferase family 4 protein n=1 Tax=Oerskovia flava TaxID=2986422 RepID=UPI002240D760|nr:glycosyltransferase family 4 protein [Oerskovia sp. JB1-3-2]
MVAVALVTSSFLPRFGGVEEHVANVALRLHARGHRVVVWSVDQGDDGAVDRFGPVPVRYLPCPMPARAAGPAARFVARAPGALARWVAAARADRPDVLHVHCFGPNGVYADAVGRLLRLPVVLSNHGETFMDADDAFDRSVLLSRSLRGSVARAAAVTACSRCAADDLERRAGQGGESRTQVVFNGIDLDEPAGAAPPGLPERYVLGVGRLVRTKGFDLLLRAFAQVDDPDLSLVIGGDGPERAALGALAHELGLGDRVVLPGRLDRGQVVTTMARSVALVVPSRVEAFGITVLEGWRAGVPVVATSVGGPPEFVDDGRTGLLVDPQDTGALAAAVRRVSSEATFAAELGAAGRRRAADFGWDDVAGAYERIYADLS